MAIEQAVGRDDDHEVVDQPVAHEPADHGLGDSSDETEPCLCRLAWPHERVLDVARAVVETGMRAVAVAAGSGPAKSLDR